ncbi:AMP-binding protein, partial [Chryseobacterium sp. JV558]|uniref:non-ribosomal peptide synthetase family protein n=1 Tax=Chryseobacterium sp. JV558 TaxID=2663236 RepID=UPI00299EC778
DSGCILVIDSALYADFATLHESYENTGLEISISGNNLAYVIYTSGTTGHPKGVMVEHHNVNSLIQWSLSEYRSSGIETVLFVTSICFDISVFEIFYSLCSGKRLKILASGLSVGSGEYLGENVLLSTVPSVVNSLQETGFDFKAIAVLNMAGEPIPSKVLDGLDLDQLEVRNLYGPTEDTIYSTCYRYISTAGEKKNIIGSPVSNSKALILDQELQLVPVGVIGELYLEGAGVSRGYLNRPELTAEKFISHPFKEGERLYRTGDLARWLADGNVEFIGRNDDQVKIRGYRIELGEISQSLIRHELIKDCLVKGIDRNEQEKDLVCYYTSAEEIMASELIEHLRKELPMYMIPNYYIWMPSFPLTSNGKIDKNSLPLPSNLHLNNTTEYIAARNETEAHLVSIWSEVLLIPQEKIGVNDNFFDLGGHSLKAMQLIGNINKTLNIKLSLVEVFKEPTITEMALAISKKEYSTLHRSLIELKTEKSATKNIFFIHDGSGGTEGYRKLAGLIENYNCWGIQSDMLEDYGPYNWDIESIAKAYVARIKEIDPVGPYNLMGWSMGGNIAYEMVKQLEVLGDKVDKFIVIDSDFSLRKKNNRNSAWKEFEIEEEKELVCQLLNVEREELTAMETMPAVWKYVAKAILKRDDNYEMISKITEGLSALIPDIKMMNVHEVIIRYNTIRSLARMISNYQINGDILTEIIYIFADETNPDLNFLDNFNTNPITYRLTGNHFSIMDEYVMELHEKIARHL